MMDAELKALLTEILENQKVALAIQRQALDTQKEALAIHQAQVADSEARIKQSVELQQRAVAYQAKVFKFLIPLIGIVIAYGIYLLIKF